MKMTDEQKALFDKLTTLEQRFAINMLRPGIVDQSQAYIDAGCGSTTPGAIRANACRAAKDPRVKAFLMAMKEEAVSAAVMSRQEALEKLTNLARTDLKDLVEFGEYELGTDADGNPIVQSAWKIKDSVLQDPAKMAIISELTAGKDGVKVKTHSQMQAIQQLAKMQGWDAAEKREITGADGQPLMPTRIELVAPEPKDDSDTP